MYSWGDDTATWKNPSAYDFGDARRGYMKGLAKSAAAKGPRTYARGRAPDLKLVSPHKKDIKSESENPVIVAVDVTGSMHTWPAEIFDRLPLLYQTLSKYKQDVEVSFSAIGDAFCDSFPLQVGQFDKGTALDDILKALCPEGGGGGQHFESYELWAYFMKNHCETPKAKSPFMFIMGDEGFYEKVNAEAVRHIIGDELRQEQNAACIWQELAKRYNIYLLHKPYDDARLDKEILEQWGGAIGSQRVIPVYESTRVVDVAMGIIARSWGRFDDFKVNLSARQDEKGIDTVMKSLRHVPASSGRRA